MSEVEFAEKVIKRFAEIGKETSQHPNIKSIDIFSDYIDSKGSLIVNELDEMDKGLRRREILSRYLLLNAVLDQGPDILGIRLMLEELLNIMYEKEYYLLHRPIDFYKGFHIFLDEINKTHQKIKGERSEEWVKLNNSKPNRYNLFFGQSERGIVSIKQSLQFSISRWGVPLILFYLLEKDAKTLIDYLESWESAEIMSIRLKDHPRYGLGKAIGNKACHLYAKWYSYSFNLKTINQKGWDQYSLQVPFDSNVGRVLFRTGWLQVWADIEKYREHDVMQVDKGKRSTDYIRVTNIRNMNVEKNADNQDLINKYNEIVTNRLRIKTTRWKKMNIPIMINALILDTNFGIGEVDDGIMYVGTKFCFNHSNPNCLECPVKEICKGYQENRILISNYTT